MFALPIRIPSTLLLSAVAAVLLTCGLLWAGVPWQLPVLMASITVTLAGVALG